MPQFINKTRHFVKYCYLTTSYVKRDACPCIDACKMALHCDLTFKPRRFDDCNCPHYCNAKKNDMQHYYDNFKK